MLCSDTYFLSGHLSGGGGMREQGGRLISHATHAVPVEPGRRPFPSGRRNAGGGAEQARDAVARPAVHHQAGPSLFAHSSNFGLSTHASHAFQFSSFFSHSSKFSIVGNSKPAGEGAEPRARLAAQGVVVDAGEEEAKGRWGRRRAERGTPHPTWPR